MKKGRQVRRSRRLPPNACTPAPIPGRRRNTCLFLKWSFTSFSSRPMPSSFVEKETCSSKHSTPRFQGHHESGLVSPGSRAQLGGPSGTTLTADCQQTWGNGAQCRVGARLQGFLGPLLNLGNQRLYGSPLRPVETSCRVSRFRVSHPAPPRCPQSQQAAQTPLPVGFPWRLATASSGGKQHGHVFQGL